MHRLFCGPRFYSLFARPAHLRVKRQNNLFEFLINPLEICYDLCNL
jgi:hypothetical protein